jgi:hypothetical protein
LCLKLLRAWFWWYGCGGGDGVRWVDSERKVHQGGITHVRFLVEVCGFAPPLLPNPCYMLILFVSFFQPLPTNLVCKYISHKINTMKKNKKYLNVLVSLDLSILNVLIKIVKPKKSPAIDTSPV